MPGCGSFGGPLRNARVFIDKRRATPHGAAGRLQTRPVARRELSLFFSKTVLRANGPRNRVLSLRRVKSFHLDKLED